MLDIAENRGARRYRHRIQAARALWALARPLLIVSPRPLFGWRRWLLRRFGARIGSQVHVYPNVDIAMPWNLSIGDWSAVGDRVRLYSLGPINIGARATISQHAHLCAGTHDYCDPSLPLCTPPICIGDDAWICADAFVGPGVTVGSGAVVGARAVVVNDVPPWIVVAGNPARTIGRRRLRQPPRADQRFDV
jgi:putative colanic acid biosynthesis acetyltransferase WcaF